MLKRSLKFCLFVLICFLIVEQSYRVYVVGPLAFNPVRFNSMSSIMYTDLVELSPYSEVFFQLKPDLDTWFAGRRFKTNSHGYRDREYSLEKPANVYRIAMLGSSWTMGSGVEDHESYPSRLEQMLNEQFPERRFEVLNFGVEMYGLREIVGTQRHRVMAWQPDLVMAAATGYTGYIRWEEPGSPHDVLPQRRHPFFDSYLIRTFASQAGIRWLQLPRNERPHISLDDPRYEEQIVRFFREMRDMTGHEDIPLAIMWLSWGKPHGNLEELMQATADELGVAYLRPYRNIAGTREIIQGRQVSRFDNHPNAGAHARIADILLDDIKDIGLIPGVQ